MGKKRIDHSETTHTHTHTRTYAETNLFDVLREPLTHTLRVHEEGHHCAIQQCELLLRFCLVLRWHGALKLIRLEGLVYFRTHLLQRRLDITAQLLCRITTRLDPRSSHALGILSHMIDDHLSLLRPWHSSKTCRERNMLLLLLLLLLLLQLLLQKLLLLLLSLPFLLLLLLQ